MKKLLLIIVIFCLSTSFSRPEITGVALYNKSGIIQKNLVKYKRLKDPQTGAYKNYRYPAFIDVPFNPETDEYPYPVEAINMTYDGLNPSDKGYKVIAKMLVKIMKRY